jgi:outer membrane protein W
MKSERRIARVLSMVGCGFAAAVLLSGSASAQGQQSGLSGRLWVGSVGRYVLNDNDSFTSPGFGTVELQVKGSSVGVGGDLEYRINNWFGLDAAVGYSRLNVQFTTTSSPSAAPTQSFGVLPVLLALNVHLIHGEHVDLWAGPQIGYVMFPDDLSYTVAGGTFQYQPKAAVSWTGFVIGADIKLTRTMALNFATRWQDADADASGGGNGSLTIDPTFVTIGITRKF